MCMFDTGVSISSYLCLALASGGFSAHSGVCPDSAARCEGGQRFADPPPGRIGTGAARPRRRPVRFYSTTCGGSAFCQLEL